MKSLFPLLLLSFFVCATCHAVDFDARQVFGFSPARDVDSAVKRSAKDKKKVIMFTYDPKESDNYPGYSITAFMNLQETKKIVKDKFIVVLLERGHADLKRYPSPGAPEKAYYVVLNSEGKTVKADMVFRNGDEGLKVIKQLAAMP